MSSIALKSRKPDQVTANGITAKLTAWFKPLTTHQKRVAGMIIAHLRTCAPEFDFEADTCNGHLCITARRDDFVFSVGRARQISSKGDYYANVAQDMLEAIEDAWRIENL